MQYSLEPIDSDYDSGAESDILDDFNDSSSSKSTLVTTTEEKDPNVSKATSFLSGLKLSDRFHIIQDLGSVAKILSDGDLLGANESGVQLEPRKVILAENKQGKGKKAARLANKLERNVYESYDNSFDYVKRNRLEKMKREKEKVKKMIAAEMERRKREEEERKRRIEEER